MSEPVTLLSFAPTSESEGMRRLAWDCLRCGVAVAVEELEVLVEAKGKREPDARGDPGPSWASRCGAEQRSESMALLAHRGESEGTKNEGKVGSLFLRACNHRWGCLTSILEH